MSSKVFEIIRRNQISVACVMTASLSIPTFLATLRIHLASSMFREDIYRVYYFKGVETASHPYEALQPCSDCIEMTSVKSVIDWTVNLGFIAAGLHLSTSLWTIYKKSFMSVQVWIIAQLLAFAALTGAILLPILNHLSSSYMLLSLFNAVLVVDAILTFTLLCVVTQQHCANPVTDFDSIKTDVEASAFKDNGGQQNISRATPELPPPPPLTPPPPPSSSNPSSSSRSCNLP